jgi:hypothetical protein
VAGRDITEGDSNVWDLAGDGLPTARGIAEIGILSSTSTWQNSGDSYDVAIGGKPFFYAISDSRPYIRQTAPYRKEQFDNNQEPGEQSLTGWWLRSQSSFHGGTGINFYDPSAGEKVAHRFNDSKGVNVWTKGQATMLKDVNVGHVTTHPVDTNNGRSLQQLRSIQWGTTNGVLLHDGYDVDKIDSTGTETHFIDYNAGSDDKVYAICDDGKTAYWVTNDTGPSGKLEVNKKALTADSGTSATPMFTSAGTTVTNAVMEYVKDRIVMAANNKIYEFSTSAGSLPTALYTHSDTDIVFTSITASGPAIYISGYSGIQSYIFKFTLNTAGVMPTLTTAITAAEMPVGEKIHKIFYYLGYMMIGTNKGIRAAVVSDQDGSISYGPLIVETTQPCYDFAARDRFVWCATSVAGEPGVIRIDLGHEVETLRFAYANDIYYTNVSGVETTSCAFIGETNRLAFCTEAVDQKSVTNKQRTGTTATITSAAHGYAVGDIIYVIGVDSTHLDGNWTITSVTTNTITYTTTTSGTISSTAVTGGFVGKPGYSYIEAASTLMSTGYITTGYIRYGTLEPKNFKRLLARGIFTKGSLTLATVDKDGVEYDHITYESGVNAVEVTTSQPENAQEYVAYKFTFNRDSTTTSTGPIFKGYQVKATIATPRQRALRFPVYCFDIETDRYNVISGYEGSALERLQELENIEEGGDVVTWQDLTTGETRQIIIDQISFTRMTPPDRRFDGFGGVIEITIRTV